MIYIFLGPPGSGKGTQAKKLAERLKLYYFGAGDILRTQVEEKTPIGEKIAQFWAQNPGGLIDDNLVDQIIAAQNKKIPSGKGIIFDGYPRTIKQAESLEKLRPNDDFRAININVTDESLIKRLSTRRVCENCAKVFYRADLSGLKKCDHCQGPLIQRQDDDPEVVKERIMVYNQMSKPLINYYRNKNILIDIDGEPPIDKVEKEIWEKVNAGNSN